MSGWHKADMPEPVMQEPGLVLRMGEVELGVAGIADPPTSDKPTCIALIIGGVGDAARPLVLMVGDPHKAVTLVEMIDCAARSTWGDAWTSLLTPQRRTR